MLRNTQQQKYHKQTFQDATNGGKSKTKLQRERYQVLSVIRVGLYFVSMHFIFIQLFFFHC